MQTKGLLSIFRNISYSSPLISRSFSSGTFFRKDLTIELTKKKKEKPKFDNSLKFGAATTDHIFEVDWELKQGWQNPRVVPYHNFEIDPCNATLHYAIECFEGMKAFHCADGKVRIFRPDRNMERFRSSCARMCLPVKPAQDFDGNQLLECIKALLKVDKEWIPPIDGFSMYIRPTAISMTNLLGVRASDKAKIFVLLSPVGPYFTDGFKPLKIYAENVHVRAFPGGAGHYKVGSNYGPSILISSEAEKKGYHQVLWLTDGKITEIGASNFFFFWVNENGEKELVTAPLDGLVLPGITRDSILTLAKEKKEFKVSERYVTIDEFVKALKEKRVYEAFGAGTAVTVGPVHLLHYNGVDYEIPIDPKVQAGPLTKEMHDKIKDIQYGRINHPWNVTIE